MFGAVEGADDIPLAIFGAHMRGQPLNPALARLSARFLAVGRTAPDYRMIALPASRVTCPMFGGPDLENLYVTTARIMLTPEELAGEPLAGSVFVLDAGVAGLPEAAFPG